MGKTNRLQDGMLTLWLRTKIRESGLSQAKLSEQSGVSQSQISRFMNEDLETSQSIRLSTADRLLAVLEADVKDLTMKTADRLVALMRTKDRMESEFAYWKEQEHDLESVIITVAEAKTALDLASDFAHRQLKMIQKQGFEPLERRELENSPYK